MKQFIFCLLTVLPGYCFSQSRLIDIHSDELIEIFGFSIHETNNGYLVAGTGSSTNYSEFFCWISKVDQGFTTLWSKKIKLSGRYYQVNSTTVTISTLPNEQIVVLAKSMDEDSTYTELTSFDQNGDFIWAKKWSHPNGYGVSNDMNKISSFPNNEFIISHSARNGNIQMRLAADGTVLSSRYTHLVDPDHMTQGVSNFQCSDGGVLQILRSHEQKSVVVKLNAQHQVSWAKELQSDNGSVWLVSAYEKSNGGFWIFGSYNSGQSTSLFDQAYSAFELSANGDLAGVYRYQVIPGSGIPMVSVSMGIAQVYPTGENKFIFGSTESAIGIIDQNNGAAEIQQLDLFQANHGFQNFHKLPNEYAITGLGSNWMESKIQLFPSLESHPCLLLYEDTYETNQDTVPAGEIQISDVMAVVDTYSSGNSFNPLIQSADISFLEECRLGLEKNEITQEFSIYPNPVTSDSYLTLKRSSPDHSGQISLYIFDLQGKQVLHSEFDGMADSYSIDIHSLQAGIYMVSCISLDSSKNFTGKLIIR